VTVVDQSAGVFSHERHPEVKRTIATSPPTDAGSGLIAAHPYEYRPEAKASRRAPEPSAEATRTRPLTSERLASIARSPLGFVVAQENRLDPEGAELSAKRPTI